MLKNILITMMLFVSSLLASNTLGLEDNGNGIWNVTY